MGKSRIIVDRIEGEMAVCEVDGTMVDIPLSNIGSGVHEGDIIYTDGANYSIAKEETEQRRTAITDRFARLKARQQ